LEDNEHEEPKSTLEKSLEALKEFEIQEAFFQQSTLNLKNSVLWPKII